MFIQDALNCLQNLTSIKITQAEIARALGVDPSSVSTRIKRNGELKQSEIEKLNKHFNTTIQNEKMEISQYFNDIVKNDDIIADYYPDVFGSCGSGTFVLSETREKMTIPRRYFSSYSKFKTYSIINARGDSMTPYIQNRDLLIVEHWDGDQIWDNSVYVFRFGDEIFVKRLIKNIDQVIIKSDNEIYPMRIIEGEKLNDFQIIGQIVGLMRDLKV